MLDGIAIEDPAVTAEEAAQLPICSVGSAGSVTSTDGAEAYERFLSADAQSGPEGGVTLADVPSALTAPTVSASSSDLEI